MTPTIGGTQSSAVYRIISTIIGCYTAVAFWLLFPGNSIALPILTFLFSIPNFWYVFCASYNPKMGRMTLLAYNLTMLRSYNYRDVEDYSITDLAVHRLIAISIGVLTGVAVTYWIWPYRAREELREGLSNLLLNLAWLYNQHVAIQSHKVGQQSVGRGTSESDNMVAVTVEQEAELAREALRQLEREIQVDLLRLRALLEETPHEPRFKGPFPTETYNALLTSCQNILDRFTSMRIALSRSPAMNVEVHRDFILPVNAERREMMQNVLLFFYTLASALKLKTPLPPGLPPAQQSWKRLMHKIRDLPVVRERRLLQDDGKYISYYAFIAMMEEIVRELTKMGSKMSDLFGFLVNLETWNSYFN
ncbi:hypothetical protein BZG36_03049 [Bifiguratus adelaidae]|uniref:Uncharacterized protein n=1 Tax=Bifiguratus adelaidae TaxID=1938954 RepID=A0A261XZ18_9FUNG|nr:hypothetical protein BZG36_03049 [Bifiguratus adelaidae]